MTNTDTYLSDPVNTLTSPSNLLRRKLCRGSARMEHGIPSETSPEAEEGHLLHEACASEELDSLHGEQREAVECALQYRDEALEAVFGSTLPDDVEIDTRKRLVFLDVQRRELFRGAADFVAIGEDRALVVEYKFGHQPIPTAGENLQLAAYACMLAHTEGFTGPVDVALIRPRAPKGEAFTVANYTEDDLLNAATAIRAIHDASNRLDAPLSPSQEACRHCRAKLSCPAFHRELGTLPTVARRDTMLALPLPQLGRVWDAIKYGQQIRRTISAELVSRINDDDAPGWKLRYNGTSPEIANARAAYTAFQAAFAGHERYRENPGGLQEDFLRCVSVEMTPLVELVHSLQGGAFSAARQAVEELLAEVITCTPKAPSPVRT